MSDGWGRVRGFVAEGLAGLLALVLLAGAAWADQAWFDRHFLPVFFVSRPLYVLGEGWARAALVLLAVALVFFVRPLAGRLASRTTPRDLALGAAAALLAMGLAVLVGEGVLRLVFPRSGEAPPPGAEPLRRADPRLGWTFVPGRVARQRVDGREIDYAFDARGYRVAGLDRPVDPARPTVLFTGESIVAGYGLPWAQTIPARVGAALGLQSADMAVFAYADDQSLMRLRDELPRFARPRAVVILFSPGLLFRDFEDDRPHLGPGLEWRPAEKPWRLWSLVRFFLPYHGAGEIGRRVALARAELEADVRLARARGATPLIVAPHFGPDDPREDALRMLILQASGLPYVWVEVDPAWRLPRDPHPDSRGAAAIASAVVARLQADGV